MKMKWLSNLQVCEFTDILELPVPKNRSCHHNLIGFLKIQQKINTRKLHEKLDSTKCSGVQESSNCGGTVHHSGGTKSDGGGNQYILQ